MPNNYKSMPIVYVLVLLLIQGIYPQCQPLLYRTNITADNFRIADQGQPSNTFTYTFKSSFNSLPQTAFSITGLATRNNNSLFNTNFRVFADNITKNSLQIFYISTRSSWVIGSICLWVSTNSQLWIGSSLIQNSLQFTDSSLKRLTFQISNPNLIPVKGNQITRCFINGFNVQGVFESLSFINNTVISGGMIIQLEIKAQNISTIWFSIINFGMANGQFDAYGGSQLITAENDGSISILSSFSSSENLLFGLSGLNTIPTNGFLFSSQISSNFMLDYKASKGNYIISYLFVGYPSRYVCSKCPNSQNIFNNGSCTTDCPANSIQTTLSDGGKMCRYCMQGMIIDSGKCGCPQGTSLVNGKCVGVGFAGLVVQSSNPLNSEVKNIYNPRANSQNSQIFLPDGTINQYFEFSSSGISSQYSSNSASSSISTASSSVASPSSLSTNQASTIFLPQSSSQVTQSSQAQASGTISASPTSLNEYSQVFYPTYQSSPTYQPQTVYTSSASSGSLNTQSSASSLTSSSQSQASSSSSTSNSLNGLPSISCPVQNSFFNGNQCVCYVSFIYINGKCISASSIQAVIVPAITNPINNQNSSQITCQQFAYYNGTACVCYSSYFKQGNTCQLCPPTTIGNGFTCSCPQPYILLNNRCVTNTLITCPQNSKDNGIGVCVCNSGFQMSNNVCISQCPPSQTLLNGICICTIGHQLINGICQHCPSNSLWSSVSSKCIFVCGLNAKYNQIKKQCECIQGFGRDATATCQICTGGYYLIAGYCVSCPVNSYFNSTSSTCVCNVGFITNQQGICVRKCKENEDYNKIVTVCQCKANLTRVGTDCVICSGYSQYGQCLTCPNNSVFIKDKCVCNEGYISDVSGRCVFCSSLPDTYLLNNRCIVCPNNKNYNSSQGKCVCPPGKDESGSSCIARCESNELLDRNGNCYSCGQNMVISNGSCVCVNGYLPDGCGGCKINCKSGQFQFMGLCAICPMSTVYIKEINGCVCPNGYYLDGRTNTCEKSPFSIPDCSAGTYYDASTNKCSICPSSCLSCSFINQCTSCRSGYSLQQGACQSICGDGLIRDRQTCDSGATFNPGCNNCIISSGYSCIGQPSICTIITPVPPTPPTPGANIPSLIQKGNFTMNTNNVFVVLQTNPTFSFPNAVQMQNFMKANFTNSFRATYYCSQQLSPNLDLFSCILIYPSGIPNSKFTVVFSYNYGGKMANTSILIDPITYAATRRRTTA